MADARVIAISVALSCAAGTLAAQEGATRAIRAYLPELDASPRVALAVDIDLDGDRDLLVGCEDSVRVWRNEGQAGFVDRTAGAWPDRSGGAAELRAADIDGDSVQEVLVVSAEADGESVRWFDSTGDGRFVAAPPLWPDRSSSGQRFGSVVDLLIADLDDDTHPDVLAATGGADQTLRLQLGDGQGHFAVADDRLPKSLRGATALAAGQLTATGGADLELLVAISPAAGKAGEGALALQRIVSLGTAQRLRTTADPAAQPRITTRVAPRGLVVADLDGDGDRDLLIRDEAGHLGVLQRTATADVWREATEFLFPPELPLAAESAVARLGGRGARGSLVLWIATAAGQIHALVRARGHAAYQLDPGLLPGVAGDERGAVRLTVADFDGDHRPDLLLVGAKCGVELWLAAQRNDLDALAFTLAAQTGGD